MKRKLYGLFMIFPVMTLASCGNQPAPHVHSFGEWQQGDRDHFRTCTGCDEVEREGHNFELVHTDEETCTDVSHQHYKCTVCDYEMIVDGDHLKDHSYELVSRTAATCAQEGVAVYKCNACENEYTVRIPIDENAHKFDAGVKVGNVITYTCDHNHEHTITRIDASEQRVAEVNTDDLKATGAIELETAAIAFDEDAMDEFEGNVSIAATPVSKEEVEMPAAIAEKVGDNQIIDFSVKNSEEEAITSFAGKVTVTVPYTLKPGESPEGITILYLNGEESEALEARYHDGEVTFETNHFSMYAVAHYEPEELCEEFGHSMMLANEEESTCKAHGFKEYVCRRCNFSEKEMLPLSTHDYQYVSKQPATATEDGYVLYKCSKCQEEYRTIIEKTGGARRGFYENLIYSLGSKPVHLHGVETMNGQSMPMDAYMGRDVNEEVYGYVNIPLAGMGEEEAMFYKGLTLDTSSLKADNGMAQKVVALLLNQYQSLMDEIPAELGEKINAIGDWVVEKICTKVEQEDGGFVIGVDGSKISELIQSVMAGTLGDTLELLFGEDIITDIKSIAPWLYGHKVSDLIAWLEEETGLNLERLYNKVMDMIKTLGVFPAEMQIPSYNDIIAPYKDLGVIELATMLAGQEKIPETAEGLNEMLDTFLDKGIMEIVSMLMGMMPGSSSGPIDIGVEPGEPQPGPEPAHAHCAHAHMNEAEEEEEEVIEFDEKDIMGTMMKMMSVMLEKVHVSLRTTAEGNFVSASIDMDPITIKIQNTTERVSMNMLFTIGFDEAQVLNKLDKLYELALTRDEMLTVENNLPAITNAAKKATKNINFEYVENYDNRGNALVGNYTYGNYDKIVIVLKDAKNNSNNGSMPYYYDSYISVMRNPDGIAGDIAKNGYGLQLEFRNFVEGIYWQGDSGYSPWQFYYGGDENYTQTYLLMNLENKQTFVRASEKGGRIYDYLDGHFFKFAVIDKDAYPFGYFGTPQPGFEMVIVKGTCQNCGSINYWFLEKPISYNSNTSFSTNASTFLTPDMNRAAVDALTSEIGSYSWLSLHVDENKKVNIDYSAAIESGTYGNVQITQSTRQGQTRCIRLKDTLIKVGGKAIVNNTYKEHDCYDYTVISKPIASQNPCETRVAKYKKCNDCGKTYFDYIDYSDNHNYQLTEWYAQGSATKEGLAHMVCTRCGNDYYSERMPCNHTNWHYDEAKGCNVCDECGVEMSYDPNGEEEPIIIERYENEMGEMRFGFFFANKEAGRADMYNQYNYASMNYSAYFTYSYVADNMIITLGEDYYRQLNLRYTMEVISVPMEQGGTARYDLRRNFYAIDLDVASNLEQEVREAYQDAVEVLATVILVNDITGAITTIVL